MQALLPEHVVVPMLNAASIYVQQALLGLGDRVIPGGATDYIGPSLMMFRTWNTNNHQQTYGVLLAAIAALRNYMSGHQYGSATFTIFDGVHEVAAGMIGLDN